MNQLEYIELIKKNNGLSKNIEVVNLLHVSPSSITGFMKGEIFFSPETAIEVYRK